MPACPVCAYDNPGSATECANCGADLRTDVPAATPVGGLTPLQESASAQGTAPYTTSGSGRGSPDPAGTVRERPPGGGRTPSDNGTPRGRPGRRGADLSLEPAELQVDPGSAGTVTVTVHNLGAEVERFTLEVNGPGGAFATPTPRDLRMLPDKKESAVLRFTPARDPAQRAGSQPFQVVARSTVNPDVVERAAGVVTVGGFDQLDADLVPEVTRGRRKPGTHRLELVNTGNQPAAVAVELCDDSGELTFDPATAEVRLEPGEREELPIQVSAPYPWFGRTQSYPFTAEVTATGVPQPARLTGVRRQVPRFPWWVPTAALAVVGVALAIWALIPKQQLTVPSVRGLDPAAAMEQIEAVGYDARELRVKDAAVSADGVIGTEPPAGTQLRKGEVVSLLVSRGRCEGPCPPVVPNVVRLTYAEAVTLLERVGLTPREARLPDPAIPADEVIETQPGAGEEAPDSQVAVTVSSGPMPTTAPPATPPEQSTAPSGESSQGPTSGAGTSAPSGSGGADGGGGGPLPVVVPDLAGRPQAEAEEELEGRELTATVESQRSNAAPAGHVLSTVPAAGQEADQGSTVRVVVAAPTDLPLNGGDASWATEAGRLTFPTAVGSGPPVAREEGDGGARSAGAPVLVTEPATDGSITATFALDVPLIDGDHLCARVTHAEDEVSLGVVVDGQELIPEVGPADGDDREVVVDLSPGAEAVRVLITVTDLAGTGSPEVRWQDLRIEGRTE